jgi:hypothetical protein
MLETAPFELPGLTDAAVNEEFGRHRLHQGQDPFAIGRQVRGPSFAQAQHRDPSVLRRQTA